MAKLLEGKIVADKIKEGLKLILQSLKHPPVLTSIIVGDNTGALAYVRTQAKIAASLGIVYRPHQLAQNISEDELIDFILKLNADPSVNGIIIQSPLPPSIDYMRVCEFIQPNKDVEGMYPFNIGKMLSGRARIAACTVNAVMELLASTEIDLYGKEAVVVGHSEIVGKPLAMLFLEKFATVTICHIATSQAGKLKEHVERADVLVVAVGQPGLIKGEWIKKGAIVVDVGINCLKDKVVGDVEFQEAQERASYITPVPGGVGPLTVAILMRNLVEAAQAQQQ
ncbi:MAG: bifunctional 5,10-methylene-tetrahydrofolate dehydrogenase/5,10-methylene-tetrahydrofolate cyclohydrolase [Candidatus Omnitrophica bacterium CG11_big_fil_rev_8_21_14_0_20_43_6]|nr:MAG: bifunctional 5,10-methylene-tetrahydrofolate dehydrogenase/5,10-methylene-tetrahydrofolate cyclohydrolase [Candidatus Omnitrophica bacterium CG11_big_fil_rev_8_21_14_0_20_43_6]